MNAILVFDPSNDLVFAKSNQPYRKAILRYSILNGILADTFELRRGRNMNDTNKSYMDVLMLLLTPYVASLRLSSSCLAQDELLKGSSGQRKSARASSSRQQQQLNESDLLSKFMSSININHECPRAQQQSPQTEHGFVGQPEEHEPLCEEFAPRKFASVPMPVECLQDCQIVYCDLYDFIFIYMQELEQVSSFKMRLLQKRIDLFARLAMLLFGPALNAMRPQGLRHRASRDTDKETGANVDQSQILRQTYEVWLENQFEPQFLLEANESLILSAQIKNTCSATLQKISHQLRSDQLNASHRFKETHMHALLYSHGKLVGKFSCKNSQPLNNNDLILILLLVNTYNLHHDGQLANGNAEHKQPEYCYPSNYNANKHTYEINSMASSNHAHRIDKCWPADDDEPQINERKTKRRRKRKKDLEQEKGFDSGEQRNSKLSSQFLVFLSTSGKRKDRLRVPHMIRFVSLSQGAILVLISEISTSYLCLQINRVLQIITEFSRSPGRIKLSQLFRIIDCVCAIKNYFHGQSYDDDHQTDSDQHDAAAKSSAGNPSKSTSWFGQLIGRHLRGDADDPDQMDGSEAEVEPERRRPSIYASLSEAEQVQCRQLVCRLEDLVSSNVHTYALQGFNRQVDEPKREALLTSVSVSLRESIDTFVLQPKLALLNEQPVGDYLRSFSEQLDEVRLLARTELNDYLDFLAVKSTCNVRFGAPLTHDIPATRAFIYVDRDRQQLLVSPMEQSEVKMDQRALIEADFTAATSLPEAADERLAEESSSSEADNHHHYNDQDGLSRCNPLMLRTSGEPSTPASEFDNDESGADEAGSDSSHKSGFAERQLRNLPDKRRLIPDGPDWSQPPGLRKSSWLLATSGDLTAVGASSDMGSSATGGSSQWASDSQLGSSKPAEHQFDSKFINGLNLERLEEKGQALIEAQEQQQHHLVDENLMKAFTCFIYNRLANGLTRSFSSNDGTYVYSYFLWFKRNSVRSFSSKQ